MADFCHDCTQECFAEPGETLPNDFRFAKEEHQGLCEGCGHHRFDAEGKRIHPIEESVDERAVLERCLVCFPLPENIAS